MAVRRIVRLSIASMLALIVGAYLLFAVGLWWTSSEVQALVQGLARTQSNAGSESSIVRESYREHKLTLLNHGLSSLYARLDLIRRAKKSIELEFFIYELDFSARWITSELISRARDGVKVRLLVDFAGPVFKLKPQFAELLRQNHIEVRYYNTSPIYEMLSIHHRNHRKLLVADDRLAITGGRNIADDYFEISSHYNFWDSDILIEGEMAKSMRETFDLYWNSRFSTEPKFEHANDFLVTTPEELQKREWIETRGKAELAQEPQGSCRDLLFVTDFPGIAEANRHVYPTIASLLQQAKSEVIGESPYFVLRGEGEGLLRSVTERGVEMKVLTNSLHSTDAYYTVATLWFDLNRISKAGVKLLAYQGAAREQSVPAQFSIANRWGTHSKRAVIDSRQYLIGTYNVDPRSANLNSEMIIVCRDGEELAKAAREDILSRMARAEVVADPNGTDRSALVGAADTKSVLQMILVMPLAQLFGFLL